MPDVGVLQLTIHDNSEQAAGGLDSLSSTLKNLKTAVSGFKLSGVSTQINTLVANVKASDSTIGKLGTLFNAIANYKKLNDITFNAQPFRDLKDAIGDGLKLGTAGTQINQIRLAMTGDWNEDKVASAIGVFGQIVDAGNSITASGTAKAIKDVASAINSYQNAMSSLSKNQAKSVLGLIDSVTTGQNIAAGISQGVEEMKGAVASATKEITQAIIGTVDSELEIHSPSRVMKEKGLNIGQGLAEGLIESKSTVQTAMKEVSDIVDNSVQGAMSSNADGSTNIWKETSDKINESKKAIDYSGVNISSFVSDPLTALMERYASAGTAADEFKSRIAASIPVLKDYRDMALAIESKKDLAGFSKKSGDQFIEQTLAAKDAAEQVVEASAQETQQIIKNALSAEEEYDREFKKKLAEQREAAEAAQAHNKPIEEGFNQPLKRYSMDETNRMADNLTELDLLKAKLREAQDQYNKFVNKLGAGSAKAVAAGLKVSGLRDKIWEYQQELKEANSAAEVNGMEKVTQYMDSSKIELLTEKYNALQTALAEDIQNGRIDTQTAIERAIQIQNLGDKIEKLKEKEGEATKETSGLLSVFSNLHGIFKRMFPTLSGLLKRFKSMVIMRSMRYMIRQISAGFSEGVKNVYEYSKAIGSSFSKSMDGAASSLLQMKNSLGAAAAPLIQALIPVLQTVVSWFITAINYVNQFLSLLRGQQTWTRALPATASAFDDQKKAAKGASSAMKDLLADWDELNIIQSNSGGGGGGVGTNAAEDYLKMFEETSQYENKIKSIVDYIKNNLDVVKKVAEGIGATILTWKLSKAFGNTLGFLKTLEVAAGITLLITGVEIAKGAGYDIGKNGINNDNLLGGIGGVLAEALGGGLVGVAFGGIKGGLIGLTVGTLIGLAILGANISEGAYDALYGDVKLTSEEIRREVDALFTFDVNAELTSATVDHQAIEKARNDVISEMQQMNADYITFKMKLTPESATELLASVNNVVDTTNTLLKSFQKKISLGFGFDINYSDPEFVQKFSTNNLTGIDSYVTELGKGIGKILEDGVVDGVSEQRLLGELMTKLQNVTRAISMGQTSGKFMAELEKDSYGRDWTNVSRESLQGYANRYTQLLEDAKQAGYLQAVDTQSALGGIYHGMVQRNIDEPGTYTDEELEQARKAYMEYDVAKAIDKYVELATADGKAKFMENMMTAFQSAISKADISSQKRAMTPDQDLKDWINKNMASNLGWNDDDFQKVMDSMGITGWDLLTKEYRRQYVNTIINALGNNSSTYERMKNELGIPIEDILAVSQRSWDGWANKTRKGFIANLTKAYSGHEVLEAMKNAGYDIGDIVSTSLLMNDASRESMYNTLAELYGPEALLEALSNAGIDAASYGITAEPIQIPADVVPEGDYTIDTQIEMGSSDVYEQLKKEIQSAMEDGVMSTSESLDLMFKYGFDQYDRAMNELQLHLDEEGNNIGSADVNRFARNLNPENLRASAGYSDANFGSYVGTVGVTTDDATLTASVKKGTEDANVQLVTALNSLLAAVNAISRKEFIAKVTPSTVLGIVGRASAGMLSNVTGVDVP